MINPTNQPIVVGVFDTRTEGERALADLRRAGFADDRLGIVSPHQEEAAGAPRQGHSEAGVGAAIGTVAGGLAGAAAVLLLPGLGAVLAGGALLAALSAAAVGAAAGQLVGVLVGLGIPEHEAREYERAVRAGRTIVTVEAGQRAGQATEILRRDGAQYTRTPAGPNDPLNITDTVQSTAESSPTMTQPIRATQSEPQPGIGPNLPDDLTEPVLPNEDTKK